MEMNKFFILYSLKDRRSAFDPIRVHSSLGQKSQNMHTVNNEWHHQQRALDQEK